MNPIDTLMNAGFTLSTEDDSLVVAPASAITDALRSLIRQHRGVLIQAVRDAESETAALISSINRA